MLNKAANDLGDMSLKALCAWGTLLVKAVRHSHGVIRNGTDLGSELEHWGEVRSIAQQQLVTMLGIVRDHLEDELLPSFEMARAFEFVGLASAVFQEEAHLDRELNATVQETVDPDTLSKLWEEFGNG